MGAIGISVPIIIHILNRRRFKVIDWAAMKFLLDALRKNRRRLRIEELILLALRCLIILLLGVALARFVGCSQLDRLGLIEGQRTVVFVLDDSYSMGQVRGSRTAFSVAVDDLKSRIGQLRGKDQVAILLTSRAQPDKAFVKLGPVSDPQSLLAKIGRLRPSDARTDLSEALITATGYFQGIEGSKRLYVLGDFRRVDMTGQGQAARFQQAFAGLQAADVAVTMMDYGRAAHKNLTIESVELENHFALAGRRCDILIKVRNNGSKRVTNVPVNLSVKFHDGKEMQTVSLPVQTIGSLEPNRIWEKKIPFVPELAVSTVICVKLPGDDLPGDNQAALALDVRKATKVLIVDGRPAAGARPEDAASFFLACALDPSRQADHDFDVDIISREDLSSAVYGDYDIVLLLNLADFPHQPKKLPDSDEVENYPSLAALERYVAAGGGLVIFTGDKLNTDFYNGRMLNKGTGLNPLPIRQPKGEWRRRDKYFQITPRSVRPTGPMSFFTGDAAAALQLIRFFAFTPASDRSILAAGSLAKAPVVEARFNDRNASPAVVSRRYGEGGVVMFYSTASTRFNDWPLDDPPGLFVVPITELIENLARPQKDVFTGLVGRDITLQLDESLRDATAILTPPGTGTDLVRLTPRRTGIRPKVTYDRADVAGLYRLTLTRPDESAVEVLFARNPDPVEGDLQPGGKTSVTTALGSGEYTYIDRASAAGKDLAEAAAGKEYWIWMVAALLLLLAAETFLAQRFGHW